MSGNRFVKRCIGSVQCQLHNRAPPLLSSSCNRRVNITATKADKDHVSRVTRRNGEDVKRRQAYHLAVTKSPWRPLSPLVSNPAHKLSTFERRGRDLRRTPRDGAGKAKLGELLSLVPDDWRGLWLTALPCLRRAGGRWLFHPYQAWIVQSISSRST